MSADYFTAKACEVFTKAGGNPDYAGPLASWAQAARAEGKSRAGVLVTDRGDILAETKHAPSTASTPGATYVTQVVSDLYAEVRNLEVGLAIGALTRLSGRPVIHVKYWEVCTGASQFIRTEA